MWQTTIRRVGDVRSQYSKRQLKFFLGHDPPVKLFQGSIQSVAFPAIVGFQNLTRADFMQVQYKAKWFVICNHKCLCKCTAKCMAGRNEKGEDMVEVQQFPSVFAFHILSNGAFPSKKNAETSCLLNVSNKTLVLLSRTKPDFFCSFFGWAGWPAWLFSRTRLHADFARPGALPGIL